MWRVAPAQVISLFVDAGPAATILESGCLPRLTIAPTESTLPEVMPQPTEAKSCSWGLQALIERPDCLAGIGLVAAEWSNLELALSELYVSASADVVHWPGEEDSLSETTSVTIELSDYSVIDTIESLRGRLAMIGAILRVRVSKDIASEFDALSAKVRRRGRERNTIVHGRWATSLSHPDDLVMRTPHGEKMIRYTVKDFRQAAERISVATGEVREFTRRCEKTLSRPIDPRLLRYYSYLRQSVENRDGIAYIKGADVTIDEIFLLSKVRTLQEIMGIYPNLTLEQVEIAIEYAKSYPNSISGEADTRR